MNILFFDLEEATCHYGEGKDCIICEFGFTVTDEKFRIRERGAFLINPCISRRDWDWYAVKKVLTRTPSDYDKEKPFSYFYPELKRLFESADYVVGHSTNGDVKAVNDECRRYQLPPLTFDFYDIKEIFKNINPESTVAGLMKLVYYYEIAVDNNEHDAGFDAFITMAVTKAMAKQIRTKLVPLLESVPSAKDRTENYLVASFEASRLRKEERRRHYFEMQEKRKKVATRG